MKAKTEQVERVAGPLKRDDWDFSDLQENEYQAAVYWEFRRECHGVAELVVEAKAWLEGRLSTRTPPVPSAKGRSGRQRHFYGASDADRAGMRASAFFQDFIPSREFSFLRQWSARQRRIEYDRWLAGYIRPLVENYSFPWLCLSQKERLRLCSIIENSRSANVVHVPSWWEAIGHFKDGEIDAGSPLIFSHDFEFSHTTTLLLRIDWAFKKKRILAAIKNILDAREPKGLKRYDRRGRKHRDKLAMLERLGMLRLLHHYTLGEVRLKLPEAWKLYETRKWYDERRRALKDFRSRGPYTELETSFPVSWETKMRRLRKDSKLPAK